MPGVGGFTREALAGRAAVPVGYVDRLVELGLLVSPEADAAFSDGDLRRVRLLHGLEQSGLPLEGIGAAVRNGDLSFGFMDLPIGTTYGEFAAETGVSLELLQAIRESMGFARPESEDPVHEELSIRSRC
jgi:hypothetical protein